MSNTLQFLSRADLLGRTAISYLRFSSKPQEKGSSIDRQEETLARIVDYFQLVRDTQLEDRGLSASKGHHRKKGQLKLLLEMVERREIKPGTVLIIEAIDRLFREGILDVFPILRDMVRGGLIIVTGDFTIWNEAAIESSLNHKLIAELNAARDYATRLGQLASGAHATKRKLMELIVDDPKAGKVIHNCRPPGWLVRDGLDYVEHPKHAATLRKLFQLYLDGLSTTDIARRFNAEGVPVLGDEPRSKHPQWRPARVGALLRDRRVIGFMQPATRDGTKHIATGRAVRLYPEAIDAATWIRVQEMLDSKVKKMRGRKGSVPNLFTGRIFCGTCGGAMRVDTGGARNKNRTRKFQCQRYVDGRTCMDASRYEVSRFEREVVWKLVERTRLGATPPRASDLDAVLPDLKVRIETLEQSIATLAPRIGVSAALAEQVEKMSIELDGFRKQEAELLLQQQAAASAGSRSEEAFRFLQTLAGPALDGDMEARGKLRSLLAGLDFRLETVPGSGGFDLTVNGRQEMIEPS